MYQLPFEWLSVILITCLAVISPGPDFAMVSKIAISKGRRAGILCALGIGAGVTLHLIYTLLGFGILLSSQGWLVQSIKLIGAGYLIWLGLQSFWPDIQARIRPSKTDTNEPAQVDNGRALGSEHPPFMTGFICNALNPKTMLFIVALYSQVVSPDTGLATELGYGAFIAAAHVIWFALIASLFTGEHFKRHLARFKRVIERCCGGVMILFGIKMLA